MGLKKEKKYFRPIKKKNKEREKFKSEVCFGGQ